MICLCLTGRTLGYNHNLLKDLLGEISAFELRIDTLENYHHEAIIRFATENSSLLSIASIRRKQDGGWEEGAEYLRRQRLLKILSSQSFRYVDLEEDWWCDHPLQSSKAVLCSMHSFKAIPENIEKKLERMSQKAELVKLACMTQTTQDVVKLWSISQRLKEKKQAAIVIAMGEQGMHSRILSPQWNSILSYVTEEKPTLAPGQLSLEEIHETYHYTDISDQTSIFGIIGMPLAQSPSPIYHNRVFYQKKRDAVYLPFLIDSLTDFWPLVRKMPLKGLSVTTPYKENIILFLDSYSEAVAACGSCNTVISQKDDLFHGENSDIAGFLSPLHEEIGNTLKGMTSLVIGAGGAARSVCYALLKEGVRVRVLNRNQERAYKLVHDFVSFGNIKAIRDEELSPKYDLIVQCTSVGMTPHINADPLAHYNFRGNELVYDIIAKPPLTHFLRRAEKAGCICISGLRMFEAQAKIQSDFFCRSTRLRS